MKKLLAALLALVMIVAIASCGKTETPAEPLEDKDHALWTAHGQYLLADGTENGWNGKSQELYEKAALKAITLDDVKAIDNDLYTALSGKEVKYLYTIDVIFGTNDAGWSSKFIKDGTLYNANGSYCFKIASCTVDVDGDAKIYAEDQWISNPHNAYVESLTPATVFYPTWQEEKDENGFSWADNPVCIGGAGLYTIVIAQYKTVSAAGTPGYGVGLILKEAKEGKAYEEIKTWIPGDHTYGIVGSFEASGWADGKDIAMTKGEGNVWTGEVELKADNELKVRADGKWDNSWGDGEGNFKVTADGTYVVTITFDAEGNGTASVTAKQ